MDFGKIFLLLLLTFSFYLTAKVVPISGEYEYIYGDNISFVQAKKECLDLAKRDAVGKFATSISSVSIVKNYMTEKEQLISISLGIITDVKYIVKEENKDTNRIFYKISGKIDEDKVFKKLEEKLAEIKEITMLEGDVFELIFNINTDNVYISKNDGAPVIANNSHAVFKLPKGDYSFKFIKDGYKELTQDVTVSANKKINISLQKGSNNTKLKLPSIIRINSQPGGSEVYLNDQKVGLTPMQYSILPGAYDLKIKREFYYSKLTDFTIKEGETFELPIINLKPKFGSLTVNTEPTNSKIYIDDVFVGNSPFSKDMVESGLHSIKAEYELYHSNIQKYNLKDGENKIFELNLKPAFGEINIVTTPEKAAVYIDGKKVGYTPFNNKKMPSAKYQLNLKKKFYSDIVRYIEVEDQKKTDTDIVMDMNVGVVEVKAENSTIYVNDEQKGKNIANLNLSSGNYKIKAIRQYHKDAEQTVFVNIGKEYKIDLKPEPILGSISVISEPFDSKGAEIFIDNKSTGKKTPSVFPFIIGDHSIKLSHSNFLDVEETFSLSEGETKKISMKMLTYQGSQKAKKDFWRTQKWIALGSSVAFSGAGLLCSSTADGYYDDYMKSTDTNESVDLYDKSTNFDLYKDVSYGVSLTSLGYFAYAWYMESKY